MLKHEGRMKEEGGESPLVEKRQRLEKKLFIDQTDVRRLNIQILQLDAAENVATLNYHLRQ